MTTSTHAPPSGPRSRSPRRSRVVVGVDGTPASLHALDLARAEAELMDASLEVVWAWWPVDVPPPFAHRAEDWATDRVAAWATSAAAGPHDVLATAVKGGAARALLHEATEWQADLVVVGAHGPGLRARMRLGSVSRHVVESCTAPVMVVRGGDDGTPTALGGPLVVGIDASPASRRALRWALHEAARRATSVVAVHGWGVQPTLAGPTPGPLGRDEVLEGAAERLVAQELAAVESLVPTVAREGRCLQMTGDEAVLSTVSPGGLVVVGTHGRPGPVHRVLGSVSHEVVTHAPVPVVALH